MLGPAQLDVDVDIQTFIRLCPRGKNLALEKRNEQTWSSSSPLLTTSSYSAFVRLIHSLRASLMYNAERDRRLSTPTLHGNKQNVQIFIPKNIIK